jgi:uncharacterized cysteine cluster protein YcgN (CxxCxxCC family)
MADYLTNELANVGLKFWQDKKLERFSAGSCDTIVDGVDDVCLESFL